MIFLMWGNSRGPVMNLASSRTRMGEQKQGCPGRWTREAAVSLCNKLQENNSQKLCTRDGLKYMEITNQHAFLWRLWVLWQRKRHRGTALNRCRKHLMWPDPSNVHLLFILVAKFHSQQAGESNDKNYEGAHVFPGPGFVPSGKTGSVRWDAVAKGIWSPDHDLGHTS